MWSRTDGLPLLHLERQLLENTDLASLCFELNDVGCSIEEAEEYLRHTPMFYVMELLEGHRERRQEILDAIAELGGEWN